MLYIISFLFPNANSSILRLLLLPKFTSKILFISSLDSQQCNLSQNAKYQETRNSSPSLFFRLSFWLDSFYSLLFLALKALLLPPLSFRLILPSPNSTVQWLSPAVLDFHSMFISPLPERIFRLRNWPLATWLAIFFFSLNLQYTLSSNFLIFRLPNCFSTSQGSEVQLREEDISN